jgi:hypothetical protein
MLKYNRFERKENANTDIRTLYPTDGDGKYYVTKVKYLSYCDRGSLTVFTEG